MFRPSTSTMMFVEMANLATKPSSRDYGLVDRLAISKNMLHEPDIYAYRSGTIVYPRARGQNSQGISIRDTTLQNTYYASSLQYMQRQRHDSTNISKPTAPGNRTRGPSGSCSMFVKMLILPLIHHQVMMD